MEQKWVDSNWKELNEIQLNYQVEGCSAAKPFSSQPPTVVCQAHKDAVQQEWQSFLNLCIAQETHLENIEDYTKVDAAIYLL